MPAEHPFDPLAALPGIDASIGRVATGGNDKLYRKLLHMFGSGQRDAVAQFRAARERRDAVTATRIAHNLRTVSAALGMRELAQASRDLEAACHDGARESGLAPLLEQVAQTLTPVLAGLDQLPEN